MFRWIKSATARRQRSLLFNTATEQMARLTPGAYDAGRMLHGEALIISGVLGAIATLVNGAWAKMDALAKRHSTAKSEIAILRLQIGQLPGRQHLVMPAGRGKRHQLASTEKPSRVGGHLGGFLSRLSEPNVLREDGVYGDALSTTEASAEHARLTELIQEDDQNGISRHHHHVARLWRWAARAVLFFDVVALSTLTIKLENVSLTPQSWVQQLPEQAQRLLTAICFALFGAMVVAVISHQIGAHTWRYIHRNNAISSDGANQSKRVLIAGWVVLATLSALMGVAIFVRLQHEAASSNSGGAVGMCVALLIGFAGAVAPLAVGLVEAMHPSPEVLRRAALARIIRAANHDEQALRRQVSARLAEMVELISTGERLLADTRRRVDTERLPAHQAILILRSRHGYAHEYAFAITYPEISEGFLADLDHRMQLAPLVDTLGLMREATHFPDPEPSDAVGSGDAGEHRWNDAPVKPEILRRNGNAIPVA